jgi:hypothetical protein
MAPPIRSCADDSRAVARARLALAVASKRNADALVSFRILLAILRESGCDFDDAWSVAFPQPEATRESGPLREALSATRDAWMRAYLGQPAERGEVAVTMLGPLLLDEPHATAGEALPSAVRVC